MKYILIAFLMLLALQSTDAGAQEDPGHWNQFRGPRGNGVSFANNLPVKFDESKNVRWKTAITGEGWSSPVVWENEIWLTAGDRKKNELRAICVDIASGEIVKDVKVFDTVPRKVDPAYMHDSPHLNSMATPTPVVEEERVFVSFGSQGIACLDRRTGDKLWERRDLRVYQPVRQGSSPIVDDNNVYMAFDGTDQQFFVALDKQTGKTRWKRDRNVATDWGSTLRARGLEPKKGGGGKPGDNHKAFATAHLIVADGQRQLIAPAAEATIAYNPDNGEELWRVVHPGGFNVAARPLYAHGLVYVFTSGLTGYLMGIRPDGQGDVTKTHVVWSTTRGTPHIPSPVIARDLMFLVTDKGGIVRCLEAETGEEIWKTRLGGDHWASPILAGDQLYFCSKQGDVFVLNANREEPELIAKNNLKASFIASPAVVGSSLILRSTTHLYCIQSDYARSEQQVAADIYPRPFSPKAQPAKEPARDAGLAALGAKLKASFAQGTLNKDDALELWRSAAGGKDNLKAKPDLSGLRKRLAEFVKAGKLTQTQAIELGQTIAGTAGNTATAFQDKFDWDAAYEALVKKDPDVKAKVDSGQATKEDIIAWLKSQRKDGVKGKRGRKKGGNKAGMRPGSINFYAIVIGRLRSKDIELGELEIDVDYVIGDKTQLNKELVGSRVKLVGVAGQFLDALLQIKRGETIKVRTGDYNPEKKQLGFGYKFQVLERTPPFNPSDFGVPPEEFRGFSGELTGKIVEAAGYEVLLDVTEVNPADDSQAADVSSIQGKRVRIVGFYIKHADAFADLHEGDRVRVSTRHRNLKSDSLDVTDVLEKVEK
ncbi:MAG: PQQ-binding-like beta-propeller repeat protein [Planctomycetota bacterium]